MMRNGMDGWIPKSQGELLKVWWEKNENCCIRTWSCPSIGKHSLMFVNWQRNWGTVGGVCPSLGKSLA